MIRAGALNNVYVPPGGAFRFDLHLFLIRREVVQALMAALAQLAHQGLGARRGAVVLESVSALDLAGNQTARVFEGQNFTGYWPAPLTISLEPSASPVHEIEVQFITPTELKGVSNPARPDFRTLIARLRDRISGLRTFYGDDPLDINFRALAHCACDVQLASADMHKVHIERRSSRTGQIHPLGGWIGSVRYAGGLREFLPLPRSRSVDRSRRSNGLGKWRTARGLTSPSRPLPASDRR